MKKYVLYLMLAIGLQSVADDYYAGGITIKHNGTNIVTSTNAVFTPSYFKAEYVVRGNTAILFIDGAGILTDTDNNYSKRKTFTARSIEEAAFVVGVTNLQTILSTFGNTMVMFIE